MLIMNKMGNAIMWVVTHEQGGDILVVLHTHILQLFTFLVHRFEEYKVEGRKNIINLKFIYGMYYRGNKVCSHVVFNLTTEWPPRASTFMTYATFIANPHWMVNKSLTVTVRAYCVHPTLKKMTYWLWFSILFAL